MTYNPINPARAKAKELEYEVARRIEVSGYVLSPDTSKEIRLPSENLYVVSPRGNPSVKMRLRIMYGGPSSAISQVTLEGSLDDASVFKDLHTGLNKFYGDNLSKYPWFSYVNSAFDGEGFIAAVRAREDDSSRVDDTKKTLERLVRALEDDAFEGY